MKRPPAAASGERDLRYRKRFDVLGLRIAVASNSPRLLRLFDQAFGKLPAQPLRAQSPRVDVTLHLAAAARRRSSVPRPRLRVGGGRVTLRVDADNAAVVSPAQRRARLQVDRGMLAFPYLLRYELMEFCVYTLAAGVLDLAPLHGAAVALGGRVLFLSGPAGSGKSTAVVNCAAAGFELLSEDSVFVEPRVLRAVGCANFLHVRTDSLRSVGDARLRKAVARAPVIARRSGVRKFELDVRRTRLKIARRAATLAAVVVLSRARARGARLLEPLSAAQVRAHLRRAQPYARRQLSWTRFERRIADVPGFRLRRGRTPDEAVVALRSLLDPKA